MVWSRCAKQELEGELPLAYAQESLIAGTLILFDLLFQMIACPATIST